MRVYNTMTRAKEELVPQVPGRVSMYVCGPTVYNYIHIGNARPLIVFDVMRRYLLYRGLAVDFVQNITDIEDKLIRRAAQEDTTVPQIAAKYEQAFLEDCQALGVMSATANPRATDYIADIIELIGTLIDKGLAYAPGNGDVYYDTQRFEGYGRLSGQDLDQLDAGARVEVDEIKRHPMDFALWKAQKPGEPAWSAPWGEGRPGWHIECSTMILKNLGDTIDIHAGGQDLVFPHHENEIAQSEGATGKPFVRYWMHNGYINIDNRKMSKSEGNFFTVRDILEKFSADVLRLFMLNAHYRTPLNFSFELMEQTQTSLQRLENARGNLVHLAGETNAQGLEDLRAAAVAAFREEMDDDLNTAGALGVLFDYVRDINTYFAQSRPAEHAAAALATLDELCGVLGLLQKQETQISAQVQALLDARAQARKDRQWQTSDALRDQIRELGYAVEDTRDGQKVKAL